MRLTINLASENYRKTRLIRKLLWLFSILLVGVGVWQIDVYLAYENEGRDLEEHRQKVVESQRSLERELSAKGIDASDVGVKAFGGKVVELNELISHKVFSWTLLLNQLESAIPNNISVTRLQPKFPAGAITLSGKAISLKDLTRLIIKLEDSQNFAEVFLKDQATDKEGFVEFTIEFKYRSQGTGVRAG
ncbi:MAG: PilN domain-containing protein [Nitrospira sp.]|nr:PilN domain-containing protein [Nitrospira sp.]